MFGKKKVRLGIQPKARTKQEIDRDYTHTSVEIGHRMRVITQLQEEIDQAVQKLIQINAEAMQVEKEESKANELAKTQKLTDKDTA